MVVLQGIVIVVSMLVFGVGTYVVWPSRWNVPAHISLGFAFVAYVIPVLILQIHAGYPDYLVRFYIQVISLGAGCYLAGLLLGGRLPWEKLMPWKLSADVLPQKEFALLVSRRAALLMGVGLLGITVAFFFMGFIPMFASDPYAAKFFRGVYAWRSQIVAGLYRWSYNLILTLIPVCFAAWYASRRAGFLVLSGLGIVSMALALTRGPVAVGFLIFLGLVAGRKDSWFRAYIIFVLLIFPFGAAAYYILGSLFGITEMFSIFKTDTLWGVISEGSSDFKDTLDFLGAFFAFGDITHGRTFWGGLIPGHYRWNPSVWELTVIGGGPNKANIDETVSGGVRLPPAIWGYTAFEWWGVVGVSFFSGLIMGIAAWFTKRRVDGKDVLRSMVFLTLYTTLWYQLASFYLLWMYNIPPILVALVLVYYGKVPSPAGSERSKPPSRDYACDKVPAATPG